MSETSDAEREKLQADANQRTIDDVFRLYISPEVERRQAAGLVPKPYNLQSAQVVLNVGKPAEVRLNDEVKAIAVCEVTDEARATMVRGKPVMWDEIKAIADVRLTDADPNAAHITLLVAPGRGFGLFFDFRYNAARVAETINAAEQFFAAASFSASQGHGRAFAENLFAASELTAKALLLTLPFEDILTSKKHTAVASKLNQFSRQPQNVDRAFVDLYNDLGRMRSDARYVAGAVSWTADEMQVKGAAVRMTLDQVKARAPRPALPSTPP